MVFIRSQRSSLALLSLNANNIDVQIRHFKCLSDLAHGNHNLNEQGMTLQSLKRRIDGSMCRTLKSISICRLAIPVLIVTV